MQPELVRAEVERILKKYTCHHCGERTARVDPKMPDNQPIECWKCSAEIGYSAGEFRADSHNLGKAQIDHVLKSPAKKAIDQN